MLRRVSIVLAVALTAAPAWPQFTVKEAESARLDPKAFTLDKNSLEIEKLGESADAADAACAFRRESWPILDRFTNIGPSFWKIIADNRPVVNVKTQYATAFPKGVTRWTDMGGWQVPKATRYEIRAKNVYGIPILRVRYQVMRTYGGRYRGKGKYLTAVTVEPTLVDVSWGFHLDIDADVPESSLVNVGSVDDPVAGMTATLRWRVSTALHSTEGQGLYFLNGNGDLCEVGGGFSSASLEKARRTASSAASWLWTRTSGSANMLR